MFNFFVKKKAAHHEQLFPNINITLYFLNSKSQAGKHITPVESKLLGTS